MVVGDYIYQAGIVLNHQNALGGQYVIRRGNGISQIRIHIDRKRPKGDRMQQLLDLLPHRQKLNSPILPVNAPLLPSSQPQLEAPVWYLNSTSASFTDRYTTLPPAPSLNLPVAYR